MYRSFQIKNFRCFANLVVEDLERVNLIAGKNNVGKTAFLEALFLHCGAYNPELVLRLSTFRGIDWLKFEVGHAVAAPWDSLFGRFDTSRMVELAGSIGEGDALASRVLRMKVVQHAGPLKKPVQTVPSPADGSSISSETSQLLELESIEQGETKSFHMVLDQSGLKIQPLPPPPPFPAILLSSRYRIPPAEDAERFGRLDLIGEQDAVVDVLRIIDPRIRRLAVVVVGGVPMLHGDIGLGRLFPLPYMGEGVVRLASLILAIGNTRDGVVLVDEIENGIHYSVLHKLWQTVGEVARRFNTQVFATTHSRECIVAAHTAFKQQPDYDFRLFRLETSGETQVAVAYDAESLGAAAESGLEVR